MNDAVRLEGIREALERLAELADDHVLLVEGINDRRSLLALGIGGDFFHIQSSGGPARAAEYVASRGGKAVVLTDWDRKGGAIAKGLRAILGPDNADVDFSVRADLSRLCRHYIKDVESLYALVSRLEGGIRP